jgi:Family of unknown function (DUF6600)
MTTDDKLWVDKGSRAELQLGSAVIRLNENTGFSFLNLDDNTIQIQLTSGSINVRVRQLYDDNDFEVDTPNLAFSVSQPGSYRVEASEDGTYTVIGIREGEGQATGNGQTYTLHAGQKTTFSGTDSLNADVVDIGQPDPFDTWAYSRDHRFDQSRSAQYLSRDVVGFEDLDDNGDWRDDPSYGHVWFPARVAVGWAPYREGHWDWIPPWGYTWVDDMPWGYAPFHYGRWVTVGGRWGWVAGPIAVRPVYAPALVVFVGGGGVALGGDVAWFPLGPREVYVPPYRVSRGYMNQVNISNTTVNVTTITNVYNTTVINRTTNITNITYVNRNVQGAVTVVPQRTFAGAQPVGRALVTVNAREIAAAPISARVAVVPTRESVLGARFATANRVSAPPAALMNRQVIAKRTPPPPPVSFARQQQALAAHPGETLPRSELRNLRPAATAASHPMVKQAPPGRPATPSMGRPGNQPNAARPAPPANEPARNQPNGGRPGQPGGFPANQPPNRPANQQAPNERPGAANPTPENRPTPNNRPDMNQPNNRPDTNRPTPYENRPENTRPSAVPQNSVPQNNRPNQPSNPPEANRPQTNRPDMNRPAGQPARNDRPPTAQPNNRPENARPEANRPEPNRPAPTRNEPPQRTPPASNERPERTPPAEAKPAPQRQQPKAQTPAEKKQEEEQRKKEQKPPGE